MVYGLRFRVMVYGFRVLGSGFGFRVTVQQLQIEQFLVELPPEIPLTLKHHLTFLIEP